ncbi:uncharacterized protein LOC135087075 [Ostrinia nubilalis]|uniref:uncharacterized protein LOC135087075 n=1 Tax=Ostrinia nubilalis TaxID=29057 RepID=UPI0030824917
MWPRVGGHVGPPTPITPEVDRFELMPWRSPPPADQIRAANALTHVSATRTAAQSASPPYLATSCVLTSYIFTLSPPFPCPLQMRMDSFSSPRRTFQRMYRRIQHPYRLLSLSERMHIYRPILPSLQEEESTEQRPTVVLQEQRQSRTSKRRTRSISSYNPGTEQPADIGQSTQMHSPSLPRSASNQWLRQSQWPQPDEPEIIITSDVQLQTDDEQTGFVSSGLLSATLPPGPPYQELPIEYEPPSVQTVNEATPMSSEDNNVSAELTTDYLEIEVIENESYVSYNAYEVPVTEVYYQPTQMETNGMELVAQQSDVVESSTSNGDATGSVETAQNRSLKDLSPVVSFELYTRKTMPVLPAATPAAKQVANKMIKHARNNKTLDEKLLHCLNCDLFPILPVTGYCGHTRCTRCIEENGDCPCGAEAPTELHVNTVVQYLLGKMLPNENYVRRNGSHERPADVLEASSAAVKKRPSVGGTVRPRRSRGNRSAPMRVRSNAPCDVNARMPMSPQVQFEYARRLLLVGRYRDAAPHLARVAASCESLAVARNVRMLLSQVIVLLADGSDPRRIARDLLRSVRLQGASSWLKPSDLECVLCYHTYTKPITTPCGHTYCRTCIERALDYRKACALCMRPLEDFDVTQLKPSDLECVLCYHRYTKPITTPCGHTYCRTCIERALDYRKACALCMRPLEDFDVTQLKPSDLECVLCYHRYTKPITTPCGHTYCRTCIERALDYRKACALCMRPLEDFDVTQLKPSDLECVLCYHRYTKPITTPCGHTYCRTCIERALDYRKACALCMRPLEDFDVTQLKPSDLECVLCYHRYTKPITTPCGHTYCRTCIERALDYRKACALCMRPLEDFDVTQACENVFVGAALESIDASSPPQPPEPDVIPIFVCTVAYPSIPCPLFIFDPRYWLMIRRVLESSSRKFGMVAYERDRNYSDYGTVLEVCDCVHLEDGRSFLSTIGVSRFKLIERDVRDGCDVARIQPLTDVIPTEGVLILNLRMLSSQILYKALMWLNNMNKTVRTEIENAFGQIPRADHEQDEWWDSPDGPAWLWWLIAILPLRSEIKVLILSTKSLLKRMMAVSRTLEAIDQVAITTTSTSECEIRSALTNADEWLERGS